VPLILKTPPFWLAATITCLSWFLTALAGTGASLGVASGFRNDLVPFIIFTSITRAFCIWALTDSLKSLRKP
jgi:hypothetical protein